MVRNDANLQNSAKNSGERLAHIGVPFGKTILPINELHAGDIGAVAKLRDTDRRHVDGQIVPRSPSRR